jgi:hypothetical protein
LAIGIAVFPCLVIVHRPTSANFADRRHCLLPHHFGDTQQSAKRGTCGKDASDRGKATGDNRLARQKDKRMAQHKHQQNKCNTTVEAMVTAMAAAMTATTVAAMAVKTMAATAMMGGIDINQLKVAAEETAAAVTKIGMASEMATRRHS